MVDRYVRKVDELGRVVIPIELRRTCASRKGPAEITLMKATRPEEIRARLCFLRKQRKHNHLRDRTICPTA